jgi:hypothetical protein
MGDVPYHFGVGFSKFQNFENSDFCKNSFIRVSHFIQENFGPDFGSDSPGEIFFKNFHSSILQTFPDLPL